MVSKLQSFLTIIVTVTAKETLEDNGIVCAERRTGESYCKDLENYIEATRLGKIDPEQFAKFKEYFKSDLEQLEMVKARMWTEKSCNTKANVINPESAEREDLKLLLVLCVGE